MPRRLIGHVRGNVVAYIALMFSVIGGGGGYALAATTHHHRATRKRTAIVACASKRSGELFLHHRGKCAKGRHKVRWSIRGPRGKKGAKGAAGAPAPSVFAAVNTDLVIAGAQPTAEKGLTVRRDGLGVYTLTVTDPICVTSTNNVPTVTPTGRVGGTASPPSGATPVAYLDDNLGISTQFTVHVGYVSSTGTFVPVDYYFDVQDTCLPPSTESGASSTR